MIKLEAVHRVGVVGNGEVEITGQVGEVEVDDDVHSRDEEAASLFVVSDVDVGQQGWLRIHRSEELSQVLGEQLRTGGLVVVGNVGVDHLDDGRRTSRRDRVRRLDITARVVSIQAGETGQQVDTKQGTVFKDFEAELPETRPQCGGELLRRCRSCGAAFSSLAIVDCEECGEPVRPNELFGSKMRRG